MQRERATPHTVAEGLRTVTNYPGSNYHKRISIFIWKQYFVCRDTRAQMLCRHSFSLCGRLTSEKVTLQLIKSKYILVLLYCLVACPLNKTQLSSLDFVMNRFLMKLFNTSNMETVTYCREQFNFELPSVILACHTSLFLDKLRHCDNCLIKNVMRT